MPNYVPMPTLITAGAVVPDIYALTQPVTHRQAFRTIIHSIYRFKGYKSETKSSFSLTDICYN